MGYYETCGFCGKDDLATTPDGKHAPYGACTDIPGHSVHHTECDEHKKLVRQCAEKGIPVPEPTHSVIRWRRG